MRFSAISSRVKSCVSSSTLEGSLVTAAGLVGAALAEDTRVGDDGPQRKTLLKDCQKVAEALGMEATLRELARSLSTVGLTRYAIAVRGQVISLGIYVVDVKVSRTVSSMHDIVKIIHC